MKATARILPAVVAAALLVGTLPAFAASDAATREQESLETLRNTVTNLLQALVDKGLLTKEAAQSLVKDAQAKATASVAASQAVEPGAVRVPYVPQIVRDEITKQVAATVEPQAVDDVVRRAKDEGWGVPAAMPEWLSHVRVFGDVMYRAQADLYGRDNLPFSVLDYQSINAAGGIGVLGYFNSFLNINENVDRERLRARIGAIANPAADVTAGIRLSSGSLTDPGSESQNQGTTEARYAVAIDQAYIRWDPKTAAGFNYLSMVGGRIENPFFAPTELVYARDLTLEGSAVTGRLGYGAQGPDRSNVFLTVAGIPVQYVPLESPQSKWLVAAQLGTLAHIGEAQKLRFAVAYYDFLHVSGEKNAPDSTLLNYTAPQFVRHGNTMFDISNSTTNPNLNLFALAAEFRLVDIAARYELPIGAHLLTISGEGVKNVGDTAHELLARTGQPYPVHNRGYVGDIIFGTPQVRQFGDWRAALGYRYVQDDAVLDSLTDADFHLGGTNAKGYFVWGELGLTRDVWARLRYMSGNEIDGTPYGVDVLQLDLNTRF